LNVICLCFRVLIVEALEIFAASRAFASARKTPQKYGKTPIFDQRKCVDLIFALIRRFSKIVIFPGFGGVFCAHANARQTTTSNLCASNTEVWKQRQNNVRGPEILTLGFQGINYPLDKFH